MLTKVCSASLCGFEGTHTLSPSYTQTDELQEAFLAQPSVRKFTSDAAVDFILYENTPKQKNFCRSRKNSNAYSADVHTQHVIKPQGLVSIFRASSGMCCLNLDCRFVKQIQHESVGRLSKQAGHVFPLVCVTAYGLSSCGHYMCMQSEVISTLCILYKHQNPTGKVMKGEKEEVELKGERERDVGGQFH